MCTQKRYVEKNKGHRLNRHHGGGCVAGRLSSCGGQSSKPGGPRYLKSTSWYFQMLFYNSSSSTSFDGRCLLAEKSIKCRHLICLIFACLAVSASGQGTTSGGYGVSSSPRPEVTQAESWPVIYDTNTNIPLLAERRVSAGDESLVTSTTRPVLTPDRATLAGRVDNKTTDHPKNAEPKSTLMDENYVDKESVYFILNTFHRYSENDFLLKTDLEKLLANIGFTSALNSSEIGLTYNNGTHGDHSHDHKDGHHHHEQENTGHQDEPTENIHDHSSGFMFNSEAVSATVASLQEKEPGSHHAQSVDEATPETSHSGRRRRTVSHRHEEHNKVCF